MESVCNKSFVCEYCGLSFDGYKFEGAAMLKVHQLTNHLFDKHKTGYKDADSKNGKLDTVLEGLYTGLDPLPDLIFQLSDFQKNAVTNRGNKNVIKADPDGMQEARSAKVVKQEPVCGCDYHCRDAPPKVGHPTNSVPVVLSPKSIHDLRQVIKHLLNLTSTDVYVNIGPVVNKYMEENRDTAFYKRFGVQNALTFIKTYMSKRVTVKSVGTSVKIRRLQPAEIRRTEPKTTIKPVKHTHKTAAKLRPTAKRPMAPTRDRDWVTKRPARVSHGNGPSTRTTASPLQPYTCFYSTALVEEIKFQMQK